jgi:cell division GTPase FtsZ
MSILNEIISNIKQNEDTKEKVVVNNHHFLNNLDDCEDCVGNFNIKIFGIGGAGCNVVSNIHNYRQ